MLRKAIDVPGALAHYAVGSALVVGHLLTWGLRERRRESHA